MARAADELRRTRPDRVPPHNLEAEESVLGSMMLSGEAIASVIEALQAPDFYRAAHQRIYEAIVSVYARGEPVDAITTVEELRRRTLIEEVGGALYVYNLVESVPTPASAAFYAKIVADHALLRRLIDAAGRIMANAYAIPEDPRRAADEAEGEIYSVSRQRDSDEIVAIRELVDESMLNLEHIQQRDTQFAGVPTGFVDLDNLLSGLQKGNLIVVAARPGVGKSSFVTNIARNIAVDAGAPVAMFSLEMSRFEIGMRLLCSEARVPWDKVRTGRVGSDDWTRIVEAAEVLHEAPLFIVDSGNVTIVDIRAKARRLRSRREGLGAIIVDYLQLMAGHRRVDNRQQEIAEISRSLKLLAKELEIPVIAVSQLNRDPERRQDKRPQLSDLRECVTGDTLVTLTDGRRVPIRELVGTTPDVMAVSADGRIVPARSDKVWRVGVRPVFEVVLASGRRIRATAPHRLLGASGWVRVADLEVGDRLAIARRLPEPPGAEEWPDDRVALLGQLIGDGSYLKGKSLRYTTGSEANSELVTRAASQEFGAVVRRYAGRGQWHQLFLSGNGSKWHPAGVNRWLRELGIFGQRSYAKRIPESAFRLPNRQVALLLQHLWATDGCIWVRPKSQRGSSRVFFSTSSRALADDVAAILLRLDIVARIGEAKQGSHRPWYNVAVSGSVNQARFLETVGAFGPRLDPAARLGRALVGVRPNTNVDTLPVEVFDRVRAGMSRAGITTRQMASTRGTAYGGSSHFAFAPSRKMVSEYAALLGSDELNTLATTDVFWDRISHIGVSGEEEVYDLTVPEQGCWLADSIVSHNSGAIEQDSDIVMFIHRDDSDADPSVKGKADLIIAKHRNGPTGTIPVTFLPHLTLFRNFARSG
jgi:replicative DNA helicase